MVRFKCRSIPFVTKDESWVRIIFGLVSVAGVGFGVYAYLNSVKPVFDKEKEYISLRAENVQLVAVSDSLQATIQVSRSEKATLTAEIDHLAGRIASANTTLDSLAVLVEHQQEQIREREEQVEELLRDNDRAGYLAVETILTKYSDILFEKYLGSISANNESEFDLEAELEALMGAEERERPSAFVSEANKYIRDNLLTDGPESLAKQPVSHAVVSIPYSYKIHHLSLTERLEGALRRARQR